jgi:catalase
MFSEEEKQRIIDTIVDSMRGAGGNKNEIINRQIRQWFRVSPKLGVRVPKGLIVDVEPYLK